jgi:acyl-CoA synthetase (AMP-forming)/AMP-acid ligase II
MLCLNRRLGWGIVAEVQEDRLASIGSVLDRTLEIEPAREALVASNGRLTYEQLDTMVDRAAGALSGAGIGEGDVVGVSLPNEIEVVVTFYAAARVGALWLGVNRSLAVPEKSFILGDAGASVLIADEAIAEAMAGTGDLAVRIIPAREWEERVAAGGSYARADRALHDPAGIAYTSGTTGRPKGVVHSERNLLLPGAVLAQARGFDSTLRRGDCAALTILNLQVTSTLLAAQAGGTQVVMDRVDAPGIAQWVRDERITSWFGVPTMLRDLALSTEVDVNDLATLEDVWTGGTYCPRLVREEFEGRFGRRVHATYGMTEVPTVVTIEPRDEPAVEGSSGKALPHLVVEILDDEGGVLPPGQVGQVTVRAANEGAWAGAYTPMLGYRGAQHSVGDAVVAGSLRTGDIGELDTGGNLYIRDRLSSLILRGGANVYPAEVERVLLTVPGVAGAAVVGIADDRLGQRVAAAIEVAPGAEVSTEVLRDRCAEELARYKVPERWQIGTLPRNAMGKVVRPEIERWFDGDPVGPTGPS